MPQENQTRSEFHTRHLHVGHHSVDVRGTFRQELPPIVLVHGIGMSAEYFQPFAEVLAKTHDVYALDLPGYGSTPKPRRVLDIAELSKVLRQVVVELGLESPVLVGHSMGCQIVADTMALRPGLAAGCILIGPTVDPSARNLPAQAYRLFRDISAEPLSTNIVVFRNYLRMGPIRHLRTVRHMLAYRIEDVIQHCTAPSLVVHGSEDPVPSDDWVWQLAHLAPDTALREVSGGPHALQHNQPQELADACSPFLTSVSGQGPAPRTTPSHT